MNVEADVNSVGVQVILFVEDSIRWYSSIVPHLYKYVFMQSRSFMTEALNEHEQMLRMRGRPKILLARSYEEGLFIYEKYKQNMLGVITDVSYPQAGVKNKAAGINLCNEIRKQDSFIPLIIESTEESNRAAADVLKASFLNKMSKTLLMELREKLLITLVLVIFCLLIRLPAKKKPVFRICAVCRKPFLALVTNLFFITFRAIMYPVGCILAPCFHWQNFLKISRWIMSLKVI